MDLIRNAEYEKSNMLNKLNASLTQINLDLLKIEKAYHLEKSMEKDSYEILKMNQKSQMEKIITKKGELESIGKHYSKQIEIDGTLFNNLSHYYIIASPKMKRKIIGSITHDNLIFEKTNYRTIKLNSILELLIDNSDKLSAFKLEEATLEDSPSDEVHPGGLEPPTNRLRVYCSTN